MKFQELQQIAMQLGWDITETSPGSPDTDWEIREVKSGEKIATFWKHQFRERWVMLFLSGHCELLSLAYDTRTNEKVH